ncbi:hypothetical protein J4Q44_G00288940 [Coregonus suidteri]|uniref:Uncharacterized protein n=1 Tax=Coregonus suidteri TaxID=861788 RepID=A0AAN8LGT9_9TELE
MVPLAQQLSTHRIVSAVQKSGGTQLKLVMSFPNYGQAILKPMKQERDEETNFNLYYFSDFERHNAEIAAFHLDRVLGYRRIPPAVGRLVDVVTEIKDITTDHKLARTFFTSPVFLLLQYGACCVWSTPEPRGLPGHDAARPLPGHQTILEVSLETLLQPQQTCSMGERPRLL